MPGIRFQPQYRATSVAGRGTVPPVGVAIKFHTGSLPPPVPSPVERLIGTVDVGHGSGCTPEVGVGIGVGMGVGVGVGAAVTWTVAHAWLFALMLFVAVVTVAQFVTAPGAAFTVAAKVVVAVPPAGHGDVA